MATESLELNVRVVGKLWAERKGAGTALRPEVMRLAFEDIVLDTNLRTLARDQNAIPLTGKAWQLLNTLLEARPKPLSREELSSRLWPDTFVSDTNLASLIKEIRAAVGDDAKAPRVIRTVHRFGYAFIAEVREEMDPEKPIDSIAILPFANEAGSSEYDYLADGITETLINTLSALSRLRVAPRAAVYRLRDFEGDSTELRRKLNVRAALSGRLRIVGGEVLLQVELTDLDNQTQMWGAQLRQKMTDLLALQEQLSREVLRQLPDSLTVDGSQKLARPVSENHEAYRIYLKGRHHWNRRTSEGIERAIFYFQSALDSDPDLALAWSGLADSYIALASRDLLLPAELFPKAEAAASRAIELDPDLAEAHGSLGAIHEIFRWDWNAAEKSLLEALRLNKSYLTARVWYAQTLAHQGRFSEALGQMSIASESDPISFTLNSQTAALHYLARSYDKAIQHCEAALEINPHHEPAHFTLGLAYAQQGDRKQALSALMKAHNISTGEPHVESALGFIEASEDRDAAGNRMQRLREMTSTRYVSPVHFALIETALGNFDAAFEWLEKAAESRSGWMVFLRTEPRFDALRSDSRFLKLLYRTGLEGR